MWAEAEKERAAFMEALQARHGKEEQEILSRSTVGIAGLGGLGSHAAFCLARLGLKKLVLADCDRVELSNLHRQQYSWGQIGMEKPRALKEELMRINPFCEYETFFGRVTPDNVKVLFGDCQIICEAFDDAREKAMLTEYVLTEMKGIPLVAASGMAGMDSGNLICTRKITDYFYLCGDGHSDVAQKGSLTEPRVALCAAHQALMVLRLLLKKQEP